ncbi:hypothetical protein ABPG72_012033 [Tetrahymena utriculariae]
MTDNKDYTEEVVDDNYDPEAEVTGDFKPVQELKDVAIVTGEEDEDVVDKFRTKLYRWRDEQFKERGAGDLKFLKHKQTQKIRILMRQDKTHKIVANFNISHKDPLCKLLPLKTNDKSWIWSCYDFSDNELLLEKLCGRFVSAEEFNRFQKVFEESRAHNASLVSEKKEEEPNKEEVAKKEEAQSE